jgi:hypothetical protein
MRVRENVPEGERLLKINIDGVGMLREIKDYIGCLIIEVIELRIKKCMDPLSVFIQFIPGKREVGIVYLDGGKLTGTFRRFIHRFDVERFFLGALELIRNNILHSLTGYDHGTKTGLRRLSSQGGLPERKKWQNGE